MAGLDPRGIPPETRERVRAAVLALQAEGKKPTIRSIRTTAGVSQAVAFSLAREVREGRLDPSVPWTQPELRESQRQAQPPPAPDPTPAQAAPAPEPAPTDPPPSPEPQPPVAPASPPDPPPASAAPEPRPKPSRPGPRLLSDAELAALVAQASTHELREQAARLAAASVAGGEISASAGNAIRGLLKEGRDSAIQVAKENPPERDEQSVFVATPDGIELVRAFESIVDEERRVRAFESVVSILEEDLAAEAVAP